MLSEALIQFLRQVSRSPGQCIGFPTQLPWAIPCIPWELCHKSRLTYLPLVQLQFCGEILQVLVVCKYLYGMCYSNEVGVPFLEGSDNCEQLLIINLVIELCRRELFREESYWSEV